MTSRRRLPSLAAGAVLIVAAGGCGATHSSSSSSGTSPGATTVITSTSPVPTTTAPPAPSITSAPQERDRLLKLAKPETHVTSRGTVPGWPAANGAAIPATTSQVSGFGFLADKAQNVQFLGFAVLDTKGRCAGGDIEANAAGTKVLSASPVTLPAHGPCTGDQAARAAGHA